jgi:hypothetical protein
MITELWLEVLKGMGSFGDTGVSGNITLNTVIETEYEKVDALIKGGEFFDQMSNSPFPYPEPYQSNRIHPIISSKDPS